MRVSLLAVIGLVATLLSSVPARAEAPSRGAKDGAITIVEFGDFECPYCARAQPALDELLRRYPREVRIVYRNLPLSFHAYARVAAEAALAAGAQGKFWEMHDRLYAAQGKLDRPALESYAKELGLDMARFRGDLDRGAHRAQVEADLAEAERLGASGTPTFFLNGRRLVGAQPLERFVALIDEERESRKVHDVPEGGAPSRGPATAKVTIVEFSDFQCPFCARVQPTLERLLREHGADVRLVFRNLALDFHDQAVAAAEAALAAGEQGKFWPMHDALFSGQRALGRADLEKHARALGLDLAKFRRSLDSGVHRARIAADAALAARLGVTGTPAFFVNGRRISGAQPYEVFDALVREEKSRASEVDPLVEMLLACGRHDAAAAGSAYARLTGC